jgi:hypothetical protein
MPPLTLRDARQTSEWTCGRAVLETVWDFFGVRSRPVPSTPLDGTSPDTIEALLWQSGLSLQSGSMDIADLKYHTGRGRPVVCCVTEAGAVGHWVCVSGVQYRTVFYQCPDDGPSREPIASFEGRWTDQTRRGVSYVRWGIAVG